MEKLAASSRSKPRIVRELRHDDPSALTPFRGSGLHAQMVAYSLDRCRNARSRLHFGSGVADFNRRHRIAASISLCVG